MSRKGFFEMSFPKGICVCNLSSPLTFVGLTRFVSAILEANREIQKLSLSISKTTTRPLRAICQQSMLQRIVYLGAGYSLCW